MTDSPAEYRSDDDKWHEWLMSWIWNCMRHLRSLAAGQLTFSRGPIFRWKSQYPGIISTKLNPPWFLLIFWFNEILTFFIGIPLFLDSPFHVSHQCDKFQIPAYKMPFRVNAFEFPCNVTIKLKLHYIGSCIRHGMRHVSIENHVIYSFRSKKNWKI